MPNNKYIRSTKKERLVVNQEVANGAAVALRAAGSKSKGEGFATDVVSVNLKEKVVKLIQIKTKKGAKLLIKKDLQFVPDMTLITMTYSYE